MHTLLLILCDAQTSNYKGQVETHVANSTILLRLLARDDRNTEVDALNIIAEFKHNTTDPENRGKPRG